MINYDLKKISTIVFDVDGVLSNETIPLSGEGVPCRTANIKDGYALQLAIKMGLNIAIISGAKVEAIRVRYEGLGLKHIYLGAGNKIEIYDKLMEQLGVTDEQVLYMGDDIPDYQVMKRCGCPCCPQDAAQEIKGISTYVSHKEGGKGCARDVIEQVLKAQGKWMTEAEAFGW